MCHDATGRLRPRRMPGVPLGVLCGCFLWAAVLSGCYTTPEPEYLPYDSGTYAEPAQPEGVTLAPQQLEQLVAPIALYPDQMVAQILAASTYPAQIVEANRFLQQNASLKGEALAQAVDPQTWDPSVKALTQFPEILSMMDRNLSWTSSLGEAYLNNSQSVMDAVQQMRQRAQAAGNLKSTPEQAVTTAGQTIEIQPVSPDVVYIPQYDPWLVYGAPITFWPGWVDYPALYPVGPGLVFGVGIGIGFLGGFGWGWHHWSPDWRGHGIYFNHAPWTSRSPTFWGHRGGPGGALGRPPGFVRPPGGGPGGFRPGAPPGGGRPGFGSPARPGGGGMRSGAFSGFNHGGVTRGFSARGGASFGGGGRGGGGHGGGGRR